jgi:hypothetical protein
MSESERNAQRMLGETVSVRKVFVKAYRPALVKHAKATTIVFPSRGPMR